jgi:hypothetical protein
MVEHLHTGDSSRTHTTLAHRMHGVAEDPDEASVNDPSPNATTRRTYEARSVRVALEAGGPPGIGNLIRCPENTRQSLCGNSGASGTHYAQEFTSVQVHLSKLRLPMTRVAVDRLFMLQMAVDAEIHVDSHQGTRWWTLGFGDRSVTVDALQLADPNVSAVRVEHVRRQPIRGTLGNLMAHRASFSVG